MSELQEEGINAINLPLSPSHYELDPEDTMLGNQLKSLNVLNVTCICFFNRVIFVVISAALSAGPPGKEIFPTRTWINEGYICIFS